MKQVRVAIAGVVSVLVVAGGGYAWGAAARSGNAAQPGRSAQSRVTATAAIDRTTESAYTPITPCRAANTRVRGGALASGAARDFYFGGTVGFVAQGGSSGGCGVPVNATAVVITVTTVRAARAGELKAWRSGDAEPGTLFMTYGTAFNSSGAGTVRVSAAGRTRIRNFGGPTQVVIDITGYFVAPMYASVGTGGALISGSRVTKSFLITNTTSSYEVDFDRDVSHCAYSATSYFSGYTLMVEPRSSARNAVFVFTAFNGTAASDQFYLTITC